MGTNKEQVQCATCPWYERNGANAHGLCLYAPPVIQVVMPPPVPMGNQLMQGRPQIQGLRPPTGENDRCSNHPLAKLSALRALPPLGADVA